MTSAHLTFGQTAQEALDFILKAVRRLAAVIEDRLELYRACIQAGAIKSE